MSDNMREAAERAAFEAWVRGGYHESDEDRPATFEWAANPTSPPDRPNLFETTQYPIMEDVRGEVHDMSDRWEAWMARAALAAPSGEIAVKDRFSGLTMNGGRVTLSASGGGFIRFNGNITAKDRIEMKSSARVTGDIKSKRLAVEDGVTFIGRSEVNPSASPISGQPPVMAVEFARKALMSDVRPTFAEVEAATAALPASV